MIKYIFPITEYWSWGTFFLYLFVAVIVTECCKGGAKYNSLKYNESEEPSRRHHGISSVGFISNSLYFLAFLILVMLASIRSSEVGSDTSVYVGYFQGISNINYDWKSFLSFQQMEPGFQLYLAIIQRITNNYHVFFFITYSVVAGAYIKYIRFFFDEKSNYVFLKLFIYFYVANMSGMRAALGTAFLLFSYISIEKEEYCKALILTFFACMFHYSMLYNFYVILATWIYRKPAFQRRKWLWVFMLVIVVGLASSSVALLKGLFVETKYGYYSMVSISDQSLLGSSFYLIYAILCFVYYSTIMKSEKKIKGQFIETLCFLVTFPVIYVTAAYRIPNYYALPRLTIWSETTKHMINSGKKGATRLLFKIVLQIIVVLYLLFRFTRAANDGSFAYIIGR